MEFKCFIESDDGSFSREVFPYDIQDLGRETKREEGKIYYRFSPNKSITLIDYPKEGIDDASWALDFAKGNDLDRSTKLYFKIIRTSDGVEWLKTSFRFYDLEFETDEDHYVKAVFKPDMEDEYTVFENNKDKEFNIIQNVAGTDIVGSVKSILQFEITYLDKDLYPAQINSVKPSGDAWTTWYIDENPPDVRTLGGVAISVMIIWARQYIQITKNVGPAGWTKVTDESTKFFDVYVKSYSPEYSVPTSSEFLYLTCGEEADDTWFKLCSSTEILYVRPTVSRVCITYSKWVKKTVYNGGVYTDIELTFMGYYLKDCIQQLISNFSALNVKSTFLFNDPYPNGTVETDNYVTHTENILNKLYLIDKLDFKRPTASELTTIAKITLSNLNNDLFNLFQVYPFVDENGDYRYEHISYWLNNKELGIDLTQEYSQYLTDRSFKFDKIEIPNREKFSLPEAKSTDFLENEIKYDNVAPLEDGENIKDFTLKKLYTDCDAILTDLENSSNEGFVLIILDEDNNIKISEGLLSGEQVQNAELSFANLLPKYWIHDRPFYKGYINEVLTDFIMKYIKRGNPFKIMSNEDIDPKKLVKTYIGDGIVDKLTEYLNDDKDIELLYKI
jgi:hypothetical protein